MLRHARHGGFSLIEFMVTMATSLFLLSGLVYIFMNFSRASTDMLRMVRLQQELRAIMNLMTNDIRRSGYWSQAGEAWVNNKKNAFTTISIVEGNCILYTYDERRDDADGIPDSEDHGGFKLDGDKIRIRTSATPCRNSPCRNCNSGVWWTLNDDNVVKITQLHFRQVSSKAATVRAGAQLQLRRIEIVLGGALLQAPDVTHVLRAAVYIPNAAILSTSQ